MYCMIPVTVEASLIGKGVSTVRKNMPTRKRCVIRFMLYKKKLIKNGKNFNEI